MSSEVQSRPAASRGGRGASRGGRGGFGGRASTRTRDRTNGDAKHDSSLADLEDEGEIGELKKLYGAKTSLIKEMFPDWSDVDILFALRETDGDENLTVTRIAEGTISQWDEVSKPKKERVKPKTKDSTFAAATGDAPARTARGAGAGPEKTRGRAGARAAERGGRGARGRSAQPMNGTRSEKNPLSVPTDESQAWDSHKTGDESHTTHDQTAAPTSNDAPTSAPAGAAPKTWASMLRQSAVPPKPVSKPKEAPPAQKPLPEPTESHAPPSTASSAPTSVPPPATVEPEPAPPAEEAPAPPVTADVTVPEVSVPTVVVPEVAIPPSKDQLTESNLEHVVDISHPPDTDTNRSEAADSWDPRAAALAGTSTPLSASQQQHQQQQGAASKALGSGYAASAIKATDRTAIRTPSYSRRVLDQEEAVRMPVNREVDRATVQFGALNFNGAVEDDIDGDREEPETRAQPPDDSPVAHPRASLPPVAPPAAVPDAFAAQKAAVAAAPSAASSLPAAPAAPVSSAPQQPAAAASQAQPGSTQHYGRYGQTASQETPFGQKPFDAYGQPSQAQPTTTSQYDSFQSLPTSSQPQAPYPPTSYSSTANEYSQYLTSDAQSRMPYSYYNQGYGQQASQGHQEGAQNQRSYGAYPLGDSLSQYPQSNASRFGGAAAATNAAADPQTSGTSTPNPPTAGQQQPQQPQQQQTGAQGSQGQHAQQQHQGSQYPSYNHPYYASPYYAQYMNQYGAFGQGNFGGPYGKGGYGGAHHPYGVSPQTPYDHNASQASGFGAASSLHRGGDNNVLGSSGLGDYGRVGSGQSVGQQTGFGSGHEGGFGRGGAGSYQSQSGQGYGAQQSQVNAQQSGADDLKPYGDAKGAAGPSPSLARPGSATNTQTSQSGLPPPQSSQQGGVGGYGGYPSHLQGHGGLHGNQSVTGGGYGMGAGGNQNHGNSPYGAYGGHGAHGGHGGQGFGGGSYYANQQRGWGGNYH